LGVSAWWFGLLAERNTIKTDAFLQLAQIRALRESLKGRGGRVSVAVASRPLESALIAAGRAAGASCDETSGARAAGGGSWLLRGLRCWGRFVWRGLRARRVMGPRAPRLAGPGSLAFVTYFPDLDRAALAEGRFCNRFTGPLQEALKQGGRPVTWLLLFAQLEGRNFEEALRSGRRIADGGEKAVFLEEFLSPAEAFRGLLLWIQTAWKARGLFDRLDRAALLDEVVGGAPAEPILRAAWERSFAGPPAIEGILFTLIFRAAFAELGGAADCAYLCEMMPWEAGLNAAKAAVRPKLRAIAYQHGSIFRNFFNYFRDPREADGPWPWPAPDVLAADGDIPRRLLEACGHPGQGQVDAVRYLALARQLGAAPAAPARACLLVAGNVDPLETEALISLACAAFPEAGPVALRFKGHPTLPLDPIFARLGIDHAARGYELVDGDAADALRQASVVLAGGSGVAVQALAFGCSVVVPVMAGALCMSPLGDYPEAARRVSSPEELRRAVADALEGRRWTSVEQGRDFVRSYWDLNEALPRWRALLNLGRPAG
jgi:surface carbohydrate biosynthesis protein (TIGR04326 family)